MLDHALSNAPIPTATIILPPDKLSKVADSLATFYGLILDNGDNLVPNLIVLVLNAHAVRVT